MHRERSALMGCKNLGLEQKVMSCCRCARCVDVVYCFMIAVGRLISKYISGILPSPGQDSGMDNMDKSRIRFLREEF